MPSIIREKDYFAIECPSWLMRYYHRAVEILLVPLPHTMHIKCQSNFGSPVNITMKMKFKKNERKLFFCVSLHVASLTKSPPWFWCNNKIRLLRIYELYNSPNSRSKIKDGLVQAGIELFCGFLDTLMYIACMQWWLSFGFAIAGWICSTLLLTIIACPA